MVSELIHNMLATSTTAWVGVGFIFTYMAVIVVTAIYRIFKADHMHH